MLTQHGNPISLRVASPGLPCYAIHMNNEATATLPTQTYYTDPNTGRGIACDIVDTDGDARFTIRLASGAEGWVTAGDLYRLDESGRYLPGPGC